MRRLIQFMRIFKPLLVTTVGELRDAGTDFGCFEVGLGRKELDANWSRMKCVDVYFFFAANHPPHHFRLILCGEEDSPPTRQRSKILEVTPVNPFQRIDVLQIFNHILKQIRRCTSRVWKRYTRWKILAASNFMQQVESVTPLEQKKIVSGWNSKTIKGDTDGFLPSTWPPPEPIPCCFCTFEGLQTSGRQQCDDESDWFFWASPILKNDRRPP